MSRSQWESPQWRHWGSSQSGRTLGWWVVMEEGEGATPIAICKSMSQRSRNVHPSHNHGHIGHKDTTTSRKLSIRINSLIDCITFLSFVFFSILYFFLEWNLNIFVKKELIAAIVYKKIGVYESFRHDSHSTFLRSIYKKKVRGWSKMISLHHINCQERKIEKEWNIYRRVRKKERRKDRDREKERKKEKNSGKAIGWIDHNFISNSNRLVSINCYWFKLI